MQLKQYDFTNLPFSDLFQSYISDFNKLGDFYRANPFDEQAVRDVAGSFTFPGNRGATVEALKDFNSQFETDDATFDNLKRVKEADALCMVTGQQLGLFGGPLYTMFKTLTTIYLARLWEQKLNRPVIPVFWLADEDHDYQEVNVVNILSDGERASFSLPPKQNNLPPVSELEFPPEIEELKNRLQSSLIDTDFSDDLWNILNACFAPDLTFCTGFGNFIARLFSKHGLVLAGSNCVPVKEQVKNKMADAIKQADDIRQSLEKQSQKIGEQFHQQATVYDSHLFYLDRDNGRTKIRRAEEGWLTDNGHEWTKEELIKAIETSPEEFSPDVFLRPVIQDALLPTLGYVAGPGEVAYYGQMKTFYRCFNQQMPVIFPRLSATFIEPAIDRIIGELPFELSAYNNRIEDLESDFVERSSQVDLEEIFEKWKEEAAAVASPYKSKIVDVDETLEGAAEKAKAVYFNQLDKLKGKTYRAIKKHEEIQLNRIKRIKLNLFPDQNLQERSLSGIYYMNKFGPDIWDRVLQELDSTEDFKNHQLIYI